MAEEKSKIDDALEELAALGRRITELVGTFEASRDDADDAARRDAAPDPPVSDGPGGPGEAAGPPAGNTAAGDATLFVASITPPRRRAGATAGRGKATLPRLSRAADSVDAVAAAGRATRRRRVDATESTRESSKPPPHVPWWRGGLRNRPMLVSVVVHVAALVALALVVVTREPPPERMSILSAPVQEEPLEEFTEVDLESVEAAEALDLEALPEPSPADLAAIDPAPVAFDASAEMAERPIVAAADVLGGGIDVGDLMAALGGTGGGGGSGGESGAGGGMAAGATFFGRKGAGRTALFMCDNSASYVDGGFQAVLIELSRAVALMKPEQSFHIVFFSDAAYPLLHPEGIDTFLPATPANKRKLDEWLGTVELCIGGQGIRGAADLALSLKPDVVYFLSDGDHAESVIDRMVSLPLDGTVVHTFGMQADVRDRRTGLPDARRVAEQQARNQKLARIAEAHGGNFTPVTVPPQVALAASARPVKKNRVRGPVWGTNLAPAGP